MAPLVLALAVFLAVTAGTGCERPKAFGDKLLSPGAAAVEPSPRQTQGQPGQRPVSSAPVLTGRETAPRTADGQRGQRQISTGAAVGASPTPTPAPLQTPAMTPAAHGAVIIGHELITPTPAPPPPPAVPAASRSTAASETDFYSLKIEVTNPHYGDITVSPYSPDNRYPKGSTVGISVAPKTGHEFQGWRGDAAGRVTAITLVMDRDKTVHAGFSRNSFSLKTLPGPGGGTVFISPNLRSHDFGSAVLVEARPHQGYVFKSWTGDLSGSQNPLVVTMEKDVSIGALFEKGMFTLNTKINPRGFIDTSSPGIWQEGGARVTLTARPSDNYRFVSWSGDVSSTSPTITVTMNSNKSVTANFVRTYSLYTFVYPPGYGYVTPSSGVYDEGTEVTLTVSPASGVEFVEWAGNVTGSNTTIKITMDSDKSAAAYFQKIKYPFQ